MYGFLFKLCFQWNIMHCLLLMDSMKLSGGAVYRQILFSGVLGISDSWVMGMYFHPWIHPWIHGDSWIGPGYYDSPWIHGNLHPTLKWFWQINQAYKYWLLQISCRKKTLKNQIWSPVSCFIYYTLVLVKGSWGFMKIHGDSWIGRGYYESP